VGLLCRLNVLFLLGRVVSQVAFAVGLVGQCSVVLNKGVILLFAVRSFRVGYRRVAGCSLTDMPSVDRPRNVALYSISHCGPLDRKRRKCRGGKMIRPRETG
jgi:hypothetical protein